MKNLVKIKLSNASLTVWFISVTKDFELLKLSPGKKKERGNIVRKHPQITCFEDYLPTKKLKLLLDENCRTYSFYRLPGEAYSSHLLMIRNLSHYLEL